MRNFLIVVVMALSLFSASSASAVNPDEMLADPTMEARAREISKGLRCVMCRNQSIDGSNAKIARDMRVILRERLAAGDTDEEARDFIVNRYGQYVLLKPPLTFATLLLWGGPILLLALALFGFARFFRRSEGHAQTVSEMSAEDQVLVSRLLSEEDVVS